MTKKADKKTKDSNVIRPPVVAFVGHIDHGKTTLLDKIRKSRLADKEPGGITQHIGAYKINIDNNSVTFIDTPGHAAFVKMRARGVKVTDLVVLVVAADAGVQDQTKESYKHVKKAEVPFLVAINKIDLPGASIDKVKGQLSEIGIIPEDYGGDAIVVPVSGQTGEGIDDLLEMILLVAEMEELSGDPSGSLDGVVIESSLDKQRGPLATVLVKRGTLKKGDEIYAETDYAKIKALVDWQGKQVDKAMPGDPVEVLGFKQVPSIGAQIKDTPVKTDQKETGHQKEDGKIKIILKADVKGSIEAIKTNLPADVQVLDFGVGPVTERDIFLGQSTGASIFAFNTKIPTAAEKLAKQSHVDIFQTAIIYDLFEEIDKRLKEAEDPLENKIIYGKAKILAEFKIGDKRIAGGEATEGEMVRGKKVFLKRGDKIIAKSVLASLRHGDQTIEKAQKDQEFGAVFSPPLDFRKGDVIISYNDEESDE